MLVVIYVRKQETSFRLQLKKSYDDSVRKLTNFRIYKQTNH